MLLVRTRIAPSPVHGIGLYADQFIPAGTHTWRFEPDFDIEKTADQLSALPAHIQGWFKQYGYLDYHFGSYVLCVDDARFMNHSDNPTVRPDYSLDHYGVDVAARDIEIGEEITTDYRLIEKENWLSQETARNSPADAA
jgi:SET domain-containing protein